MGTMQILSRFSNLGLLRRAKVAPVHCLSPPSRPLLSALPRWWPPALDRRDVPLITTSNPLARHVSRLPHGTRYMASGSGVKGEEELGKPDRRLLIPSAKDIMISLSTKELIARYGDVHSEEDKRRESVNVISGDKDAYATSLEVIDAMRDTTGGIVNMTGCELISDSKQSWTDEDWPTLPGTTHRDGSMYRNIADTWKRFYRVDDRRETRLESTMLQDPTDCRIRNGVCMMHICYPMLQIFSLKLAKLTMDGGLVELYGYIAVRDNIDALLNYVVNISRDDPVIVEQGSFINMTGPKRGIELGGHTLIEYDMRIKTSEQEKDDLQLIDGATVISYTCIRDYCPFICRVHGDGGAVDLTVSRFHRTVEATVEVLISEVKGCFTMCLGCFVSGLHEEIRLFDGAIVESRGLKKSVAVVKESWMDLKFKVGGHSSIFAEHCCSFKANVHGHATQEIKTDFALISVNVTWSTLSRLFGFKA